MDVFDKTQNNVKAEDYICTIDYVLSQHISDLEKCFA